jgi:hypothetical protein
MDIPLVVAGIQTLHFTGKGKLQMREFFIIRTGIDGKLINAPRYMSNHEVFDPELDLAVRTVETPFDC